MIDLVKMKAIVWNGEELGAKFEELEIPADMQDKVGEPKGMGWTQRNNEGGCWGAMTVIV